MNDEQIPHARSFGSVADAYDRGRPTYPREAAAWLTSENSDNTDARVSVLELGAGTGKLTAQLCALGHDVHATEPDPAMLAVLRRDLPDVHATESTAEQIDAPDRAYDVVVAGQAFHWFDLDRALPEIARVLKPGGRISLVWNERDERIPWVRRLGAIIGRQDQLRDPSAPLTESSLFGEVESSSYRFWQHLDQHSIQDLVLSRSNVATLDEAGREAKRAEVLAFYTEYGRGMDGMKLPYTASCFRAGVVESARADLAPRRDDRHDEEPESPARTPEQERPVSDGADTEMLLIDFR